MAVRIGLAFNLKPQAAALAGANFASPAARNTSLRELRDDLDQPDLYAEWDEPATIDAVERALRPLGHVIRLEADEAFPTRLLEVRPDFVFNIAEGLYGPNREGHVPAICEFFGIPCHASDPLSLGLCLHKGRTKEVLQARGVPTAPFVIADTVEDARRSLLPFPVFVKPVHEGSGKGITVKSLCPDAAALAAQAEHLIRTYRQSVVIETWLPGAEFTVAVIGNGPEARCLPIVGLSYADLPKGAPPIYGYEAKWIWDTLDRPLDIYECPAPIPESLATRVRAAALGAYHALGCRDWCRIDIRCDAAGEPMVVELNPLPGILPDPRDNSCFPKAARVEGMDYDDLIQTVADIAWRRISGQRLLAEAAA